ncbi:MAG TPA: hypothetical protein VF746_14560 [Longimicrobium sp.]|jgi:hypothetical protein
MSSDAGTDLPRDPRPPFVGRTWLYIRDHPGYAGDEPLPAGVPGWMSPDVLVQKPDGTLGCEAVADQQNKVHVTVNNGGGVDARDVYVEVFISAPSTAFTPAATTRVADGYLTVPGYSRATIVFPWTPTGAQAGHRCLAARACLLHPPDSYRDCTVFDVAGDRHVAQRNLHILAAPSPAAELSFPFQVGNPGPTAIATRVVAREVRTPERTAALRQALGTPFVQFAGAPLGGITLAPAEPAEPGTVRPAAAFARAAPSAERKEGGGGAAGARRVVAFVAAVLRRLGLRHRATVPAPPAALSLVVEPGKGFAAVLRVAGTPAARPGEAHAIEVVQFDARERVIGGLTIVLRH